MEKWGILLIGHGSRLSYYADFINETAMMILEKKPDSIVQTCYLDSNSPSISEGMELLKQQEIDGIIAIPLFLSKGVHVVNNIPNLLGLDKNTNKTTITLTNGRTVPLIYSDPIGADPLLAELLLKNADKAIKNGNV